MKKLKYKPSAGSVYHLYNSYKELADFYEEYNQMKSPDDIRGRIQYVLKNKQKQMTEIETLYWVLNEREDICEKFQ